MPHLPSLADDATLVDLFRRHPDTAARLLTVHEAIMRAPSPFSAAEREAIAAHVSALNACQYCNALHTVAARTLDADDPLVGAVCERPEAPDDPRLAPVLAYVAKLTTAPATVGEADVRRILDAGWSEEAVSHAAFVAALYAFMNRLVEGHGLRASPDYAELGGRRLAEIGYAGLAARLAEPADGGAQ